MKFKTYYYSDPLNDDFAGTNIETKELKESYIYPKQNIFFKAFSFFIYNIISRPLLLIINKIILHQRFYNKQVLKNVKGGYYIYGNHTQVAGDAFIPTVINLRKRNYIITGPDAMSIKGLNFILKAMNVIPLSNSIHKQKEMINYLKDCVEKQKKSITIYPEAHIWPYYTKIRPFKDISFRYPVMSNVPVFCFTNCFQKRKFSKKPKILTFIDGPFYPQANLSNKENAKYLRDCCYNAMTERANNYSTYETNKFVYIDKKEASN